MSRMLGGYEIKLEVNGKPEIFCNDLDLSYWLKTCQLDFRKPRTRENIPIPCRISSRCPSYEF